MANIFILKPYSTIVDLMILLYVMFLNFVFKLAYRENLKIALLFFVCMVFFLLFKFEYIADKFALWGFVFMCLGTFKYIIKVKISISNN